ADYVRTKLADGSVRIVDQRAGSPDGTDIVSHVEFFRFAGTTYALADVVPPIARNDALVVPGSAVLNGNVFDDNGSRPDVPGIVTPLGVVAVNGAGAKVGVALALASGAKLTVNADGTYSYDPNGAFASLPAFIGSGASNTTAPDSFTYTLAGGGIAT